MPRPIGMHYVPHMPNKNQTKMRLLSRHAHNYDTFFTMFSIQCISQTPIKMTSTVWIHHSIVDRNLAALVLDLLLLMNFT